MTVETSAPMAITKPIHPRRVLRLPVVLCGRSMGGGRGGEGWRW